MRISDVRMVWGWLITTGSLLFRVAAAQSVSALQKKTKEIWRSIMYMWELTKALFVASSVFAVTVISLGVIAKIVGALFSYGQRLIT